MYKNKHTISLGKLMWEAIFGDFMFVGVAGLVGFWRVFLSFFVFMFSGFKYSFHRSLSESAKFRHL